MSKSKLGLFGGFGVEIEFMIVDRETLRVKSVADEVLRAIAGKYQGEVEVGPLRWSNELALHVIELKTNGPAASLKGLAAIFSEHVKRVNEILAPLSARLMPTGTHPWMDPATETRLWPHENSPIYDAYNKIFGCGGHGWANLQSVHINLPFNGDEEFGRLHAAVRILLPLLPALAASSPVMDGKITGFADARLEVYRHNQKKIPSLAGSVIPEPVFNKKDYEREILDRLYRDIAPHDPEGILRDEWLNSRGAIARFERDAMEIRVIDVQENPIADIAVLAAAEMVLRALISEQWASIEEQKNLSVERLAPIFLETVKNGENALISDKKYLKLLGFPKSEFSESTKQAPTANAVWRHLVEKLLPREGLEPKVKNALDVILREGTLSTRLLKALGASPSLECLKGVYGRLCDCLSDGKPFLA